MPSRRKMLKKAGIVSVSCLSAYIGISGALCTALLLGGTAAVVSNNGGDVAPMLGNVALASAAVGTSLGAVSFSTNDSGLDSVEAGVQGGFDVTDPTAYRADATGLPGRLRFGALCLGIGLFSAVYLAAALSFG